MKAIKAYRVYTYDPARHQWVICSTHDQSQDSLSNYGSAFKDASRRLWAGKQVRIRPYNKPQLHIKPPNNTQTRKWRDEQAYQMSDKADANKRYKSPG